MKLPPTPRVQVLREIAGRVVSVSPLGRVIVAVDGEVGTGVFADDLAEVFREREIETFRASIADFHRSRADRTRFGRETEEGFYRDSFDYVTLRRVLLDPFRMAGSTGFQTAAFDELRDLPVESRWETAGPDAVLVIDGAFLLRPELRATWDASVLLANAPESVYYEQDAAPRGVAGMIVDESEPEQPVLLV